jgi:hypothetical protein
VHRIGLQVAAFGPFIPGINGHNTLAGRKLGRQRGVIPLRVGLLRGSLIMNVSKHVDVRGL